MMVGHDLFRDNKNLFRDMDEEEEKDISHYMKRYIFLNKELVDKRELINSPSRIDPGQSGSHLLLDGAFERFNDGPVDMGGQLRQFLKDTDRSVPVFDMRTDVYLDEIGLSGEVDLVPVRSFVMSKYWDEGNMSIDARSDGVPVEVPTERFVDSIPTAAIAVTDYRFDFKPNNRESSVRSGRVHIYESGVAVVRKSDDNVGDLEEELR